MIHENLLTIHARKMHHGILWMIHENLFAERDKKILGDVLLVRCMMIGDASLELCKMSGERDMMVADA